MKYSSTAAMSTTNSTSEKPIAIAGAILVPPSCNSKMKHHAEQDCIGRCSAEVFYSCGYVLLVCSTLQTEGTIAPNYVVQQTDICNLKNRESEADLRCPMLTCHPLVS